MSSTPETVAGEDFTGVRVSLVADNTIQISLWRDGERTDMTDSLELTVSDTVHITFRAPTNQTH